MTSWQRRRFSETLADAGTYAVLLPMTLLLLLPFMWMVLTSLKTLPEVNAVGWSWLPASPQWQNYVAGFTEYIPFGRLVANTLSVAVLVIAGSLLSCSLVAYGFARVEFPGRDVLFSLLLATMMIPFMVRLIPLFVTFRELGWLDTLAPLWIPSFFGTPFFVFLMRQFFRTLPEELCDAARIDGCSEFGIWSRVMLPLSLPVLGVVALFAFQDVWNQFLEPLIFINSEANYTVMQGIWYIVSAMYQRPWHHLMAVSTVLVVPLIIVFFLSQKMLVEGITMTGLKS